MRAGCNFVRLTKQVVLLAIWPTVLYFVSVHNYTRKISLIGDFRALDRGDGIKIVVWHLSFAGSLVRGLQFC